MGGPGPKQEGRGPPLAFPAIRAIRSGSQVLAARSSQVSGPEYDARLQCRESTARYQPGAQRRRIAMKSHMVTGGGGARLHVVEAGRPKGPAMVFIHGFSQSSLAWTRQLNSQFADSYRPLALHMRVHGL